MNENLILCAVKKNLFYFLSFASGKGYLDIVAHLHENGGDIEVENKYGSTCLNTGTSHDSSYFLNINNFFLKRANMVIMKLPAILLNKMQIFALETKKIFHHFIVQFYQMI